MSKMVRLRYLGALQKAILLTACVILVSSVHAELITFENGTYGVTAVDNMVVTNQYDGLTFGTLPMGSSDYANMGPAYLEQKGPGTKYNSNDPESAWNGANQPPHTIGFNYNPDSGDTAAVSDFVAYGAGLDGLNQMQRDAYLGDFFLRTTPFSTDSLIVINETMAMKNMSFEIWDIDGSPNNRGGEGWKVTAYNGDWITPVFVDYTPFIAGVAEGGGGNDDLQSYDGQRMLQVINNNIVFDRFVISFETNVAGAVMKTETVGLAFNNFEYTAVPEPITLSLLGLGGLFLRKRK